jgi:hypothetical protein
VALADELRDHVEAASGSQQPRNPQWLNDRGVLEALMGRPEAAIADLRAAVAAEPSFLDPYITLGSLLAAKGAIREAEWNYDWALAASSSKSAARTKQLIQDARNRLNYSHRTH